MINTSFRRYVQIRDIPLWKHDMMMRMVQNMINCYEHKEFLLINEGQIPPNVLASSISAISTLKIPLDQHWPAICQYVKRDIQSYDYHMARQLYRIARSMASLGECNTELWMILDQKLVEEGLSRYFTEEQASILLFSLSKVNQGSETLWNSLESIVDKHYLTIEKDDLAGAIEGLIQSGKGSEATITKLKERLRNLETTTNPLLSNL